MARFSSRWLVVAAAIAVALVATPVRGYAADPDTDTTPPTTPASVSATNVTTTSLTLVWPASADNVAVTGYDVWQTYTDVVQIRPTTTNSLTITGLSASATYRFLVRARDAAGNLSSLTSALKVTMAPGDTQPPSIPVGLTAANVTATEATLSWARSADNVIVEAYEILRIQASGSTPFATTVSYPGPPNSIRLTGLSTGTTYRFAVRARDAVGNVSGLSAEVVVTPGGSPPAPACVATFRIVSEWNGAFQGEFTVTAASPITGWTVTWTFPNGQIISNLWGGIRTQIAATVTVHNEQWNATVPPTRTFGFQASWSGINGLPTNVTCTSP